jgi:hypothetical protein
MHKAVTRFSLGDSFQVYTPLQTVMSVEFETVPKLESANNTTHIQYQSGTHNSEDTCRVSNVTPDNRSYDFWQL